MDKTNASSLRAMRDQGDTLTAYCADEMQCRHSEVLPIDNLIQRLGWDFDYVADREWLRRHLTCTKCGSRDPSLIVAPAVQSGGMGAGHSSGAGDSLTIDEIVARDKARKVKEAAQG